MASYIKWFELSAALLAILRWHKLKTDTFLKHLAIVVIFITVAEFSGFIIKFYKINNSLYYNLIVNPTIFCLYGIAFYKGLQNVKRKKVALWGAIAVIIVFYSTINIFDPALFLNIVGYNLGALYIAALAICKIAEIIIYSEQPDYFKAPLIYLLLFIILYYLNTIPYFSVGFYFYLNKIKNSTTVFLNYIHVFLNYALYASFSITFLLWGKKKLLY
jgi:hypothetical protein